MRCDYQLIHASLLATFDLTDSRTCGAFTSYHYDYRPNPRYSVYADNGGECEVFEDTEAKENIIFRGEYPDLTVDELLLMALGVIAAIE